MRLKTAAHGSEQIEHYDHILMDFRRLLGGWR
jgi:hypothetical protein